MATLEAQWPSSAASLLLELAKGADDYDKPLFDRSALCLPRSKLVGRRKSLVQDLRFHLSMDMVDLL